MQQLYPSLINRLKNQHQTIENIISIIDADRLIIRPQPNKWNIQDNIAHLVRYQEIFIERVSLILNHEQQFFNRYLAEDDPEFEPFRSMEIANLNWKLNKDREDIYDLITHLSTMELNKIGVHQKFGPLNIIQWTEFFLLHEAHHIYTIFQLANNWEL